MAKRKGIKQTPNQREYAKQLQRIKNAVKRAEKRGYIFDADVVPQTPKRITKSAIQRLKETTTTKLYAKASYVVPDTGELVTGTEGRKIERQKSASKARLTRQRKRATDPFWDTEYGVDDSTYYPDGGEIIYSNVVESFIARLSEPTPDYLLNMRGKRYKKRESVLQESERAKHTLLSITREVIANEGESALGWRLQERADDVSRLCDYVLFGSDASHIASACAELASIINGGALSMEQLQDIGEQEEYNENWEAVDNGED